MRKRKRGEPNEVNFWQSTSDLMIVLLLTLLLIIMLLILYLMKIPDVDFINDWEGDTYKQEHLEEEEEADDGDEEDEDDDDSDDGDDHDDDDSGGGGSGGEKEEDELLEYPILTSGGGNGDDESKAAVYVILVDAETSRTIEEEGVTFELYGEKGALQLLNTYYPEKISYRQFETTEKGDFYLPEKIEEGSYYFKDLTEVEGYDLASDVGFTIDDSYDWPEPYLVTIPMYPSQNTVSLSLKDQDTGEAIEGASFAILADENIITADGTLRVNDQEIADTVETDEEGYGESEKLYLGNYVIEQETIPRYYAALSETEKIEVEKDDGSSVPVYEFFCRKTSITVTLTDELYENQPLEGAVFTLKDPDDPASVKTAQTDESGSLTFTDLEKNTTYILTQSGSVGDYQSVEEAYTFYVDENGYIDGEAQADVPLTNRLVRVKIGAQDILLKSPVSDISFALYDSDNNLIRSWSSSGTDEEFQALPAGTYTVKVNGEKGKRQTFVVRDEAQEQIFRFSVWTSQSMLIAAGGCLALPILLLILRGILKFWKRKKEEHKGGSEA